MAISLQSVRKANAMRPPRIVIHGTGGIGKSTFAASAPKPIFLPTEDGLGTLDVPAFPLLTSYTEVREALQSLLDEDHDYETVVIDSLDWLEPLVWNFVAQGSGVKSIEDIGYGKGYKAAAVEIRDTLDTITKLRDERGMASVLICHTKIKTFQSPEHEPYDRYQLKLHDAASAIVHEWADAVLYGTLKTFVKSKDAGFGNTITRGISTGERVMYTSERPAYVAKNRYALPHELPLTWDDFVGAIATAVKPA